MADIKMPKTGLPLGEAETKDLLYWADRKERALADGSSRYPDADQRDAAAMRAELARREGGGEVAQPARPQAPAPAPQSRALAPAGGASLARGEQAVVGAYAAAGVVDGKLRDAAASFHLVSPATSCGSLPEGCEVAISVVGLDVANETYELAGKRGLGKVALDRIAGAAGVDWDPHLTRRLDDGRDPHYCHFRAVGYVRLFDGATRTLTGEVEIDARDGSPQIEEIANKAQNARGGPRDPGRQILELRKFLLRHAESKAKNRAIRSLGVRTSYSPEELQRPFAVARLMFTGRTSDASLRRVFSERIADAMLGGQRALYGGRGGAPALPAGSPAPQLVGHAPPAVGAVPADDDAFEVPGEPQRGDAWEGDSAAGGGY